MTFHFDPDKKYKIPLAEIESSKLSIFKQANYDYEKDKVEIKNALKQILMPVNGIIDGKSLKNLIFPISGVGKEWGFDVFISHSHNNLKEAKKLDRFLRDNLGMTPFIDDYVWGSADELLREIDEIYCRHSNGSSFDYYKRNFSSSHVHTMLSMAILEAITKCKAFVFIESDESLDYTQLKDYGKKTLSPWLYQELQFVRTLSISAQHQLNEQKTYSQGGPLRISYDAYLSGFIRLTATELNRRAQNSEKL